MRTFTIEDEEVLKAAEARAESEHTSLDQVLQRLVEQYAGCESTRELLPDAAERLAAYEAVMARLRGSLTFDRMPTREERNARR